MKDKFDSLAQNCFETKKKLEELIPLLTSEVDLIAARRVATDLAWASENLSVLGKHQIGEALNDDFGVGK